MRSRYNHSRQRKLPAKAIKPYKEMKNVNNKVFNTNGYNLGRNSSWHNFLDTAVKFVIGIGIFIAVVIIVAIATMPFWV